MSKYYTPEIEEFHVGFEFESNYVLFNKTGRGSEWKEITLDDDQFGWFYSAYTNDAVDSEFRVKYLDKEDIESLGFEFEKETSESLDFEIKKPKGRRFATLLNYRFEECYLQIFVDYHIAVFRGKIKNKSELKKLLKQLNINNE